MRKHGLLADERGSAPVEGLFAIVMLMLLALGTIQVALALYGRNVVAAAAHEAARAGVELGTTPEEARAVAEATLQRAAGRLVSDVAIDVTAIEDDRGRTVMVTLVGRVDVLGPVPFPVPIEAHASARSEGAIE